VSVLLAYRWENTEEAEDAVHVSYNVTKCKNWYEPFYVAHASVPNYDERFVGYGYTRNTQVFVGLILQLNVQKSYRARPNER
jgi:hypothetical protein